ncbi:MAG: hypothetical protein EA402_09820 [Planctomycetota bacterium]|nr:MAG: hypothetical protein EA402_09820 [Planctomycetota bacterium]
MALTFFLHPFLLWMLGLGCPLGLAVFLPAIHDGEERQEVPWQWAAEVSDLPAVLQHVRSQPWASVLPEDNDQLLREVLASLLGDDAAGAMTAPGPNAQFRLGAGPGGSWASMRSGIEESILIGAPPAAESPAPPALLHVRIHLPRILQEINFDVVRGGISLPQELLYHHQQERLQILINPGDLQVSGRNPRAQALVALRREVFAVVPADALAVLSFAVDGERWLQQGGQGFIEHLRQRLHDFMDAVAGYRRPEGQRDSLLDEGVVAMGLGTGIEEVIGNMRGQLVLMQMPGFPGTMNPPMLLAQVDAATDRLLATFLSALGQDLQPGQQLTLPMTPWGPLTIARGAEGRWLAGTHPERLTAMLNGEPGGWLDRPEVAAHVDQHLEQGAWALARWEAAFIRDYISAGFGILPAMGELRPLARQLAPIAAAYRNGDWDASQMSLLPGDESWNFQLKGPLADFLGVAVLFAVPSGLAIPR